MMTICPNCGQPVEGEVNPHPRAGQGRGQDDLIQLLNQIIPVVLPAVQSAEQTSSRLKRMDVFERSMRTIVDLSRQREVSLLEATEQYLSSLKQLEGWWGESQPAGPSTQERTWDGNEA